MTHYAVVWVERSLDRIPGSKRRNCDGRLSIDEELAIDASSNGIELSEGLRGLVSPPLRVLFAVREDNRIAEVLSVKLH